MEVLKPGQHHAEPEFAMTAGVPARDRDRLDVGLPDLIGPREAAQAALHEGRAFAQGQPVGDFVHRLVIPTRVGLPSKVIQPSIESSHPQNLRLLPCLPAQNGQKGQSSPSGKSSPSSCGQPMFPSLVATDLTPCSVEELQDLPLDLRVRRHIGRHPSPEDRLGGRRRDHPGGDLGRGLVVGAVERHGADGVLGAVLRLAVQVGDRGVGRGERASTSFLMQQCLYFFPLPQGQGSLRETRLRSIADLRREVRHSLVRHLGHRTTRDRPGSSMTHDPAIGSSAQPLSRLRKSGSARSAASTGSTRMLSPGKPLGSVK